MDIESLRQRALELAWEAGKTPLGPNSPPAKAREVIERARVYLAFLEGKIPDTVSERIVDALSISPEWIKAAQKYARNHPARRTKKPRRHR